MPTEHQRRSWLALLALLLEPTLRKRLGSAKLVSASAASRFLNRYRWPTRSVMREVRNAQFRLLRETHLRPGRRGARPHLYLLVDLTSVPKTGKQLPYVRSYNKVLGVHLVVLYVLCGSFRFPVGVRVYRGMGEHAPSRLALSLIRSVPGWALEGFKVTVLADSGFEGADFIRSVRALGHHLIVGVRSDRKLCDGRRVDEVLGRGARVELANLPGQQLTLSWVRLERVDGKDRFRVFHALCTRSLSGQQVTTLLAKRWFVEAFFKGAKHDFGLCRGSLKSKGGVLRWVLLAMLAYTLASWASSAVGHACGLAEGAALILESCLGEAAALLVLVELERRRELLIRHGLSVTVHRCNG